MSSSTTTNEICKYDQIFIRKVDISYIVNNIFNNNNEITCPVKLINNYLVFNFNEIVQGFDEEFLHKGVVKTRKGIIGFKHFVIFHTHPKESKPYPSIEDIMKLLKHYNKICLSVLFTRWGLWLIFNTDESNFFQNYDETKKNSEKKPVFAANLLY